MESASPFEPCPPQLARASNIKLEKAISLKTPIMPTLNMLFNFKVRGNSVWDESRLKRFVNCG